jgi:hypothetical protein
MAHTIQSPTHRPTDASRSGRNNEMQHQLQRQIIHTSNEHTSILLEEQSLGRLKLFRPTDLLTIFS